MPRETEYLGHIYDELVFVLRATKGVTSTAFLEDDVLKRAVVRSLEIIGEATKKLPSEFRARYTRRSTGGRWRECVTD